MEHRIILYVKLLIITVVSVFACMFVSVGITGSRESGIGYGFYAGLPVGCLVTSLFSKYNWKFTLVQFVFYCLFFSGLLYAWFYIDKSDGVFTWIGMVVSILASAELANQLSRRITPVYAPLRPPATLAELKQQLYNLEISSDAYCLTGGQPNEAFTLNNNYPHWEVYYSERGQKTGLKTFTSEREACTYFLTEMKAQTPA